MLPASQDFHSYNCSSRHLWTLLVAFAVNFPHVLSSWSVLVHGSPPHSTFVWLPTLPWPGRSKSWIMQMVWQAQKPCPKPTSIGTVCYQGPFWESIEKEPPSHLVTSCCGSYTLGSVWFRTLPAPKHIWEIPCPSHFTNSFLCVKTRLQYTFPKNHFGLCLEAQFKLDF